MSKINRVLKSIVSFGVLLSIGAGSYLFALISTDPGKNNASIILASIILLALSGIRPGNKKVRYRCRYFIPTLHSLAILAFFILLNSCSAIYWTDQGELSDIVQAIHQEVNRYRVSSGLRPLTLDPLISKVAMRHSQRMADRDVSFGHEGLEQRAQTIRKRYLYSRVAENVGAIKGYNKPATEIVEGWLQNPGHLKNIRGDFELTGIGIAKSKSGVYYFTQIFVKKECDSPPVCY